MNNSKRLISVRAAILVITIIFILHFDLGVVVGQETEWPIVDEAWSMAFARRATPVGIKQEQQVAYRKLLKLDMRNMVITLGGATQEGDFAYILTDLCNLDGRVFLGDAVILLSREAAEDFAKNNRRYVVFNQENLDFLRCMQPGMSATQVTRYEKGAVWESNHRVAFFLNRWAEFFGRYKKQIARATTFLNVSLPIQVAEIHKLIKSGESDELERAITFFDNSEPLAIFYLGEPLVGLDKATLKEYLKTLVDARGKLIANYPEHKQRLLREKELLKMISKK